MKVFLDESVFGRVFLSNLDESVPNRCGHQWFVVAIQLSRPCCLLLVKIPRSGTVFVGSWNSGDACIELILFIQTPLGSNAGTDKLKLQSIHDTGVW